MTTTKLPYRTEIFPRAIKEFRDHGVQHRILRKRNLKFRPHAIIQGHMQTCHRVIAEPSRPSLRLTLFYLIPTQLEQAMLYSFPNHSRLEAADWGLVTSKHKQFQLTRPICATSAHLILLCVRAWECVLPSFRVFKKRAKQDYDTMLIYFLLENIKRKIFFSAPTKLSLRYVNDMSIFFNLEKYL